MTNVKTMKTVILALLALAGLSAGADMTYNEWTSTVNKLRDPTTMNPISGLTAYLIDYDVLQQQTILTAVIGEKQLLSDYLKTQNGATLASATVQDGLIPATQFNPPYGGNNGHAFYVTYSESLQALYFSGYSTLTPDGFGRSTLVSSAYSSQFPINYTTTFQGDPTAGAGGGWYAAMPEPTSGVLLLIGLASLVLRRKKR